MSDDEFAALYPTTKNADLATRLERSISYVEKRAQLLGLTKTPEHWSNVHKGQQNSLGRKESADTRAKKSASHQGIPLSPEHRQAISQALKGIDRGGKKAPPYARMTDPRYRTWRKAVLERDEYHCQEPGCKHHNYTGRGLQAHHINTWADFEDLRYDVSNGVTLCTKHHREREGRYVGKELPEPDLIACACGCETMIISEDGNGKRRWYVNGHQRRGKEVSPETREKISKSLKGRPLSPTHARTIAARNRAEEQRNKM